MMNPVQIGRLYLGWGYSPQWDHRYGAYLGWRLKGYEDLPKGELVAQWHIEFSCNLPRICRSYDRCGYWNKYDSSKWTGLSGEIIGIRWDRSFWAYSRFGA